MFVWFLRAGHRLLSVRSERMLAPSPEAAPRVPMGGKLAVPVVNRRGVGSCAGIGARRHTPVPSTVARVSTDQTLGGGGVAPGLQGDVAAGASPVPMQGEGLASLYDGTGVLVSTEIEEALPPPPPPVHMVHPTVHASFTIEKDTNFGQHLCIVGGHPLLGDWDVAKVWPLCLNFRMSLGFRV